MFAELRNAGWGSGATVLDEHGDILSILLGRPSDALTGDQMEAFRLTSSKHINIMYQRNMKLRKGIG